MKKAIILIIIITLFIAILSSCTSLWPFAPGASGEVGSKVGQATNTIILGFLPIGDASVMTAAQNGGISKIGTVDIKLEWYFVFTNITTIVTGE